MLDATDRINNQQSSFVRSERGKGDIYYLVTQVIDRGQGIQKKDMGKLFTTFNDAKKGNNVDKGVGLGLSTAKELSYCLGGGISLQSNPN